MRLLFDGPDGGGKTTLAEKLAKETGMKLIHFSYPKTEDEKKHMFEMYADAIYRYDNAIFDRCWYSEIVYGKVLRQQSAISLAQMIELEKLCAGNGGGIIMYCTDSLSAMWQRFSKRGDDFIEQDFDKYSKIFFDYETLMHRMNHVLPVVRYELSKNLSSM